MSVPKDPEKEMEMLLAEAQRDFLFYVRLCNPKYIISDVHVYLAKLLQGVAEDLAKGKSRRILISTPPRVGKSTLVSIEFATWLLGRDNWREVIAAGYAQEFINKHSRSARNRVWFDPNYKKVFPKTKIIEGDSQVREWAVTGGGRFKAVGVQGQATGSGASCLLGETKISVLKNGKISFKDISKIKPGDFVLSYEKKSSHTVWRRVKAVSSRPANDYVKITTASGRVVKATGEHPFFTEGGWVKADNVSKGDSLLLAVQEGFHRAGRNSCKTSEKQRKNDILLNEMLESVQLFKEEDSQVQRVRKSNKRKVQLLLQCRMPVEKHKKTTREICSEKKTKAGHKKMRELREDLSSSMEGEQVLLQKLHLPNNSMRKMGGQKQPELPAWIKCNSENSIQAERILKGKAENYKNGHGRVCGLQRLKKECYAKCSPHRPKSIKQQMDELSNPMLMLSQQASQPSPFSLRTDTVALVERIHRKTTVWNLQVEGTENYFAEGILTHNCLIIDDPIKNIEEALSENQLEKIWDAFLANLYTRLAPSNTAVIIIQTRWSKDDLIGRLASKEFKDQLDAAGIKDEWEYINIPALAEDNDPLGRKPGEPLAVERFSLESWNEKKATQTDYIWAALYCGHPVAKGGNYIRMDRVETVPWESKMQTWTWMRYWDIAAVENQTTDYTVGIRGAIDPDTKSLYLMAGNRFKSAWPVSREKIKDTAINEKTIVGIESNGGFKTATANLREVMPPTIILQEVTVAKDKLARALPWIALAEKWKVKFIRRGPEDDGWISEFKEELSAWPYSAHDDCLDAISGVHNQLNSHLVIFGQAGGSKFTDSMNERRNRTLSG